MGIITNKTGIADKTNIDLSVLRDEAYFRAHKQELMGEHAGEFVAIRGEIIVGAAGTLRELHELLYQRFNDHVYAFVQKVCLSSFDPPEDPAHLIF